MIRDAFYLETSPPSSRVFILWAVDRVYDCAQCLILEPENGMSINDDVYHEQLDMFKDSTHIRETYNTSLCRKGFLSESQTDKVRRVVRFFASFFQHGTKLQPRAIVLRHPLYRAWTLCWKQISFTCPSRRTKHVTCMAVHNSVPEAVRKFHTPIYPMLPPQLTVSRLRLFLTGPRRIPLTSAVRLFIPSREHPKHIREILIGI